MTVHLVRATPPPAEVVGADDRVLYDRDGAWTDGAGDRVPDDHLVDLLFACVRVIVW